MKISGFLLIFPIFCTTVVTPAEDGNIVGGGFYFGSNFTYSGLSGEYFDGDHFFYSSEEILLIPKLESSSGFNILAGWRMAGGGVEAGYTGSALDVTFAGLNGEAKYDLVFVRARAYPFESKNVQPALIFGVNYTWLTVLDASATYAAPANVTDAIYTGPGFEGGLSIDYFISPNVTLSAGCVFRLLFLIFYEGATGYIYDYTEMDTVLTATSVEFNLGFLIGFGE